MKIWRGNFSLNSMGRLNVLSRSGSPVFNEQVISDAARNVARGSQETMTVSGVVNKTGLLTLVLLATIVVLMALPFENLTMAAYGTASTVSGLVGLGLVLAMCFKKDLARYIAFPYAVTEGVFLWALVSVVEIAYSGIAFKALGATVILLASVSLSYKMGFIKVNDTFLSVFKVATIAAFALILLNVITAFVFKDIGYKLFGLDVSGGFGLIAIGITVFLILWGSMSLVIDINTAETGEQEGAPKDFEWYCSVSILITMVYLYIQILKLLIQIANATRD